MNKALMSHASDEYQTPEWLFKSLDREFRFDVDLCAAPGNFQTEPFFTKAQDALIHDWTHFKACWMNPPYSLVEKFMARAWDAGRMGITVVALVPVRTDTQWWYKYAVNAAQIRFIVGRLRFGPGAGSAPFPSAIVVFGIGGQQKTVWMTKTQIVERGLQYEQNPKR